MQSSSGNAVQSVERAAAILRAVASAGLDGARLKDIAAGTELLPSTTHRLCKSMLQQGWLVQPPGQRRYFLGTTQLSLASLSVDRTRIVKFGRMAAARLAQATGDTAHLFMREGMDVVCSERCEGSFMIKALTVSIGDWRPLGMGYAGIAVLSTLSPFELDVTLDQLFEHKEEMKRLDRAVLLADIDRARELGYAETFRAGRLPSGASGVAAPILFPKGQCSGAISVLAIDERLPDERRQKIAVMIKAECDRIVTETLDLSIKVDASGISALPTDNTEQAA